MFYLWKRYCSCDLTKLHAHEVFIKNKKPNDVLFVIMGVAYSIHYVVTLLLHTCCYLSIQVQSLETKRFREGNRAGPFLV